MAGARRYVIVGIFIIAAVITPPDIVSQLVLAAPLILLFEISLLLMRPIGPAEEPNEDDADKEKESETPPAAV